jgi:hypothetical protein
MAAGVGKGNQTGVGAWALTRSWGPAMARCEDKDGDCIIVYLCIIMGDGKGMWVGLSFLLSLGVDG